MYGSFGSPNPSNFEPPIYGNFEKQSPDIFECGNYSKSSPYPNSRLCEDNDCHGIEREICSTQLDNIQEEQVVMENLVEYYVPRTINYKFSDMFRADSNLDNKNGDFQFHASPNYDTSNDFYNNLKPTLSKSLTHIDSLSPKYDDATENGKQPYKKYSDTFLNHESTVQELNQQNRLAQDMLNKYFTGDDGQEPKTKCKRNPSPLNEKDKSFHTVSSLLKRYFKHTDKNEQVSLKPSDGYVFLHDRKNRNLNKRQASVKVVRPFKYHKKFWESGSNCNIPSKTNSPFRRLSRKRSRKEFDSNIALKQDSSTENSMKTENMQFIKADDRRARKSDTEVNRVLYKTDSKNFDKTYSLEELESFVPDRYMSLRNVFGCNYIENIQEQSRTDYNISEDPMVKFFDSGSHIKVTDDDYRRWLKEKNLLRYTDFANSSVSSVTFKSISQKIVNYSLSPNAKPAKDNKISRPGKTDKGFQSGLQRIPEHRPMPDVSPSLQSCKFVDVEYNNLYQLVLYEHIVMSNVINFYCSFNATRTRKLTILDRVYQVTFLLFCYYVLWFMNGSIFDYSEGNWF